MVPHGICILRDNGPMERVEILIIGGGIAGLSTAWHLARRGMTDVLLLDREPLPGFYSSGHNAGIGRQLTGKAEHTALTVSGLQRLAEVGLLEPTGGLLLGAEAGGTAALAREAEAFGLRAESGPGSTVAGLRAEEHLRIPSDGVIDVDRMLAVCAEGARSGGARLRFGCAVRAIHPGAEGFEVETDQGPIRAARLVNAAGGWAQALGRLAGGLDLAFQPLRRHLVWSPQPWPVAGPWAWWADRPFYLRSESGGLLLCCVEEEAVDLPPRGQQPPNREGILEDLSERLKELAPDLADLPIARLWNGLRTFTPDRRFMIGADPLNPRLFWVAGLGGHGMTSGLAVGDLAARALAEGAPTGHLDPARFA
ncbi:MAG: 4-methylaminobutanoate oxidase (formaldehyde-forming) [Acidobacteria bacterium ADurb.Bin340]|nr:MAG: 4-methylaminobutanoate oxidase (formaldehyde-forming) [Acidobacteria bacterium ADurb.Bin340]